jgi:hypothetical protein
MVFEPAATLAAEAIVNLLRRVKIRWGIRIFGVEFVLTPSKASETIDARLEKIEVARASLEEALAAMDDLKETAEENKRDLATLSAAIDRAENEKTSLTTQLETLKSLAALDSEGVRKGLGLPTAVDMWRERIYGFVFGIIAAVLGSLIWELGIKPVWERPHAPAVQPGPQVAPQPKGP